MTCPPLKNKQKITKSLKSKAAEETKVNKTEKRPSKLTAKVKGKSQKASVPVTRMILLEKKKMTG
jgi:hypothetical protein